MSGPLWFNVPNEVGPFDDWPTRYAFVEEVHQDPGERFCHVLVNDLDLFENTVIPIDWTQRKCIVCV